MPAAPAEPAPGAEGVSAFGDSVIYGAAEILTEAGMSVDAAEARTYREVVDSVLAAQRSGTLRDRVVLHTGNNSPVVEDELRNLVETLATHEVYLVTVHVPRSWEQFNNELFARVAGDYPNVTVLDWNAVGRANPDWFYDDRFHLAPPDGRTGYADWLLRQTT